MHYFFISNFPFNCLESNVSAQILLQFLAAQFLEGGETGLEVYSKEILLAKLRELDWDP